MVEIATAVSDCWGLVDGSGSIQALYERRNTGDAGWRRDPRNRLDSWPCPTLIPFRLTKRITPKHHPCAVLHLQGGARVFPLQSIPRGADSGKRARCKAVACHARLFNPDDEQCAVFEKNGLVATH